MENNIMNQNGHTAMSSPSGTININTSSENESYGMDFDNGGTIEQGAGVYLEDSNEFEPLAVDFNQGYREKDAGESFDSLAKFEADGFDQFESDRINQFSSGDEGSFIDGTVPVVEAFAASYPEEAEAAKRVILGTNVQEVVIGRDERRRVRNTTSFPFRAICQLKITAKNGRTYIGTGWLVSDRTVITAGHCVYLHGAGGWAKSIEVSPGQNGRSKPFGSCKATAFRSVRGWVSGRNRNYDYGAIILPPNCRFGRRTGVFNFANLSEQVIRSKQVNVCGYPGDKGGITQWYMARRVSNVTNTRLIYTIDTAGGQSGSPIYYRMGNGRRVAVGIHTSGSQSGNGGTRINRSVHGNITRWAREGR